MEGTWRDYERVVGSIPLRVRFCSLRQVRQLLRMTRTTTAHGKRPSTEPTVDDVAIPCFEESETAPAAAAFFEQRHPTVKTIFLSPTDDRADCDRCCTESGQAVFVVLGDDHSKAALSTPTRAWPMPSFALYDVDSTRNIDTRSTLGSSPRSFNRLSV